VRARLTPGQLPRGKRQSFALGHGSSFGDRRTTRRRLHAFLFALATAAVSFDASAAPALPVVLTYRAPPDCPSQESIVVRVAELVRHQPSTPVVAIVAITRQTAGFLLELDVEGGRQRIVGESCDTLVQTLTVILALAIDPRPQQQQPVERQRSGATGTEVSDGVLARESTSKAAAVGAAPLPAVVPPATSVVPPSTARVPRASPVASQAVATPEKQRQGSATDFAKPSGSDVHQTSHRIRLHPTMLVWTEYGMLPGIALGPMLGLWVDRGNWSLAATAEWLLPRWTQIPDDAQQRGGYVSFLGGKVGPCLVVLQPGLARTCVGVEAGDMMGKGSGVSTKRLGHGIWLAATADLAWRLGIWTQMSADLRLGIALPIKRPAFGIDGYSWRFEPHPWSLRLASGFSWF
jgi:hypothetical protein